MADGPKLRLVDKVAGVFASLGIVATAASAFVWFLVPLLVGVLSFTAIAILGGAAIVGLLYFLLDENMREKARFGWRLFASWVGLQLVKMSPGGTLRDGIKEAKKKAALFTEQHTIVHSVRMTYDTNLETAEREREAFMEQAITAKEMGDERTASKLAEKAENRRETIDILQRDRNQVMRSEDMLNTYAQELSDMIESQEDKVVQILLRDKMSEASSGAVRTAHDLLGSSDISERDQQALKIIQDRIDHRMAEVDMALDATTGFVRGINVKKATVNKAAMSALLEYEKAKAARKAESEKPTTSPKATAQKAAAQQSTKNL